MNDWYRRHIKAMQLNGLSERTQQAYARMVRLLLEFHRKEPEAITEEDLEAYFLHRKNVTLWAPKTMRICYSSIKFFFVNVIGRDWRLFNIVRAQTERRLPSVLSREEVRSILAAVGTPHNFAFLSTVYACGLRLQEAGDPHPPWRFRYGTAGRRRFFVPLASGARRTVPYASASEPARALNRRHPSAPRNQPP